jgi:hypothetical protein
MEIKLKDLLEKYDEKDKKHMAKIINENLEYFQHSLELCLCFLCKCGSCKCQYIKKGKL